MRWISVRDRMPADQEWALIYCEGYMLIAKNVGNVFYLNGYSYDPGDEYWDVTHWIEIGDIPKPESKQ